MRPVPTRRFAFGVRAGLIAVVLLPTGVLMWESGATVRSARDVRASAEEVGSISRSINRLTDAQTALTGERYWGGAVAALRGFGLSEDEVAANLGFDLRDRYEASIGRVDDAMRAAGLESLLPGLADARDYEASGGNTSELSSRYLLVDERVVEEIAARFTELGALERDVDIGADIAAAAASLRLSVDIHAQVSRMASTLFAVKYPGQADSESPNAEIVDADARYRYAVAELRAVSRGGEVGRRLDVLSVDPVISRFRYDVQMTVSEIVGGESMAVTSLADVDYDAETNTFLGAIDSVAAFDELIGTAATQLTSTSAALGRIAQDNELRAIQYALAALGFTAAVLLWTSRWMIQPLRSLSADAGRLSRGVPIDPETPRGPREVRDATVALRDAAAQLQQAESQARQLAEHSGDPSGHPSAEGADMGTRLTAAFSELSDSIAEREALRQRLDHEAHHDGLTDLANRSAVLEHLTKATARAARAGTSLAVLFVDVDYFKRINDQYGHAAGDAVLREIARRICGATRSGDLVGRLGGDEFVIIAEPVQDLDEAMALARRVARTTENAVSTPAGDVATTLSIGVAVSTRGALTGEELLRDADLAVYRAKADGRSRIELCDDLLRAEFRHRCDTEDALTDAIAADALEVAYQPVVSSGSRTPVALEALVRWRRPDGTMATPDEFIAVAERTELIVELDRWVLHHVLGQLAEWSTHPVLSTLNVAVNLSPRHVRHASISTEIIDALREHDVPPQRLTVEVTETALLGELDHAVRQLSELRAARIGVSIDDFGTGYTSLELLRRLPVSTLKLDRVFAESIGNPDEESITRLIIETAHVLGLEVVAEGVESDHQADALERLGADYQQGYLHSEPLDPDLLAARFPVTAPAGQSAS